MKKLIFSSILVVFLAIPKVLADSAFEDSLLNSPFFILGVIIVANIIAMIYRRAKR